MKPVLKLTAAATLLAMALPAQSQILWDTLVDNTLNFYEDQDRESFFDINGDGALNEGDIAIGYVRIDDRTLPLPGESINDDLYGVFSVQVDTIETIDNGDGTLTYNVQFVATDWTLGTGLSMYELTGSSDVNMQDATGAVYEDVNQNLISGTPGDVDGDNRLTILDFMAEITNDTLDLINGFEEDEDHFAFTANVNAILDPIANLSLLESATISGGLPAGGEVVFHAGLGIVFSAAAGGYAEDCTGAPTEQCWARLVQDDVENPLNPTLHELTIQNGEVSGASDLVFGADGNPYFSGAGASGNGLINGFDYYGLSTNADFGLYPRNVAVPEPSMLALMGLGLFGIGAIRRRRRG